MTALLIGASCVDHAEWGPRPSDRDALYATIPQIWGINLQRRAA